MSKEEYTPGLVSIVVPVYNGENHLWYFLDSVLNQQYKNYELIIVDDGSTDNTEQVIGEYKSRFEAQGNNFVCLKQQNGGQASAMNTGLPYVKGEFLCWPDSDDIISPEYISALKKALDEHPECDIALATEMNCVSENNLTVEISHFKRQFPDNDLFYDIVMGKNINYALGKFLVRSQKFFEANGGRTIYDSRGGQNWQMMLPVLYKSKYIFVDKCLYTVVARADSHSRCNHTLAQMDRALEKYQDILYHVLKKICSPSDWEYYDKLLKEKKLHSGLSNCVWLNDKKEYDKRFKIMKSEGVSPTKEEKILYLQLNSRLFNKIYGLYRKAKGEDD